MAIEAVTPVGQEQQQDGGAQPVAHWMGRVVAPFRYCFGRLVAIVVAIKKFLSDCWVAIKYWWKLSGAENRELSEIVENRDCSGYIARHAKKVRASKRTALLYFELAELFPKSYRYEFVSKIILKALFGCEEVERALALAKEWSESFPEENRNSLIKILSSFLSTPAIWGEVFGRDAELREILQLCEYRDLRELDCVDLLAIEKVFSCTPIGVSGNKQKKTQLVEILVEIFKKGLCGDVLTKEDRKNLAQFVLMVPESQRTLEMMEGIRKVFSSMDKHGKSLAYAKSALAAIPLEERDGELLAVFLEMFRYRTESFKKDSLGSRSAFYDVPKSLNLIGPTMESVEKYVRQDHYKSLGEGIRLLPSEKITAQALRNLKKAFQSIFYWEREALCTILGGVEQADRIPLLGHLAAVAETSIGTDAFLRVRVLRILSLIPEKERSEELRQVVFDLAENCNLRGLNNTLNKLSGEQVATRAQYVRDRARKLVQECHRKRIINLCLSREMRKARETGLIRVLGKALYGNIEQAALKIVQEWSREGVEQLIYSLQRHHHNVEQRARFVLEISKRAPADL